MGEVLFLCWHRVQEGVGPVSFAERRRGSGIFEALDEDPRWLELWSGPLSHSTRKRADVSFAETLRAVFPLGFRGLS